MAPGHRRSTAPPSPPSDSDSDAGGDAPGTQNDLQSGDAVTDQNELRSAEWVEWQKYEDHVVSHTPYLGRNGPVKSALSQPKKSRKMMQPESDADDEDDDLASDPDADTDDEEVLEKRAARDTRSKAQGAAEKQAKADAKIAKAEAKAAAEALSPGKKRKPKKPRPEPEHTDTGVSEDASGGWPEGECKSGTSCSEPMSTKQLGKRKEVPLPTSSEDEECADTHRILRPRKGGLGWSLAAAETTTDAEMVDVGRVLRPRLSAFVETITISTINCNLADVEYACLAIANSPPTTDRAATVDALEHTFAVIASAPADLKTTSLIAAMWPRLSSLTSHEAIVSLTGRLHHHFIMITNFCAWRWLDDYCSFQIAGALESGFMPTDNWIHVLARDVQNLLENRVISKDFDASRYGLVGTTNSVFEYRRLAPRFLSSEEVQFEAVKLATHIISHWLDFPLDTLAVIKAACTPPGGGLECHKNLRKSLLGNVTDKQGTLDILETLAGQLRDHPLAKHNSPETETLCNIVGIIAQAKSGDLSYKPIISPGEEEERGEGAADVEMPEIPVLANVTSDGDDHLLEEFCRFLEESAEIPDLAIEPTAFQTELMKRMDYAYPYRELAPSRKHISGPDGPFTAQRARTNAGLLSAVIFRGITFGTEFMRSYPTFFTDIQDFHRVKDSATRKYVETHGKEPSTKYFCLKDAYGPCNHRRKVELADDYAAALENDSWAAKFEERDKRLLRCLCLRTWDSSFRSSTKGL
ncbi:hypothetical protein B0H10DRAFT_1974303 [Mycena sp. CBHHK59/15]|nr:hypothetical protein B0H10DRAFT_1974303 [Mycena sp. CBHHK59/15]